MQSRPEAWNFEALKAYHRSRRDDWPQSLALRTHRALSWLQRAEDEPADLDARFVFLWIAFNAAYAREIGSHRLFTEWRLVLEFLRLLTEVDSERLLYDMVWSQYPASIRLLIENRYVFRPFWDHVNGTIPEDEWQVRFARSKRSANRALGKMQTDRVLAVAINRLYVLRNQLVHGGSTWNSSVNRSQIRDGTRFLGDLVPIVVYLMMSNPHRHWGEPCFPVVESAVRA